MSRSCTQYALLPWLWEVGSEVEVTRETGPEGGGSGTQAQTQARRRRGAPDREGRTLFAEGEEYVKESIHGEESAM